MGLSKDCFFPPATGINWHEALEIHSTRTDPTDCFRGHHYKEYTWNKTNTHKSY
jgi:hypothetical protein